MKYQIIDIDKVKELKLSKHFMPLFGTGVLLSEEETMAKFHEVWIDGYVSGAYDNKDESSKADLKSYWWKEFKETL